MMNQEVITESCEVMFPPSSEVVELVFLQKLPVPELGTFPFSPV